MTKRTVLITGATKGIGLALSHYLASDWHVIGIARQKTDDFPGDIFCTDLSDKKATEILLHEIQSQYTIDAVVNNVGMAMPAFQFLETSDLDELEQLLDVNVRTTVQVTQVFIAGMKERQWGRVVNLTSRAAFGVKGLGNYAAAKSALLGLTKTWALELAEFGITVNTISPGAVETEMFRQKRPVGSEAEKKTLATIPMKRIAQPKEIAAAVAFLLSENAGFITGQTLCVDGGSSIM
jgi:3-oxoacyl-[acyl-carrier protein] reductase